MPVKPSLALALVAALVLAAGSTAPTRTAEASAPAPAGAPAPGAAPKTLRYAFPIAESNFDPAQVTDLYSNTVIAGIFDAPLEYEFLAKPVRIRTATAAQMPEVSSDFKTFTIRIKPGIYFADDPAFKGKRRELVAADYVYAIKRHYDPRWKSGKLYLLENAKLLGLSELRKEVIAAKKPFDYDREVEGARALDRYTFQVRLAESQPRFVQNFVGGAILGAMAREVVEFYGDKIGEHPVGTGPFRLAQWKRSSKLVLERNPNYREVLYDENPPEGDAARQATAARFKGRKLPLVDRVEISIIEETQPRWLSFLNAGHDLIEQLPAEFTSVAIPNNQLAPNLKKRGLQMERYPRADVAVSYFGMENAVVGGYEPHKVALRRAIALGVDLEREIRLVRRNQAIPGQGPIGPETYGYEAAYKSEMSTYDPARAQALLDLHGYIDRNGDGWRDQPDGKPLVLEYATQPDQQSRQLIELWKKNMDALRIRIEFKTAKWPENLKASRAGKLMMWGVGWSAGAPDGETFIGLGYGPNKGQANHSRFDRAEYNRIFEAQRQMPDGPERLALMHQARDMMVAWMPYKVHAHRIATDLVHPWVIGYHASHFRGLFWKYVDVDPALQAQNLP